MSFVHFFVLLSITSDFWHTISKSWWLINNYCGLWRKKIYYLKSKMMWKANTEKKVVFLWFFWSRNWCFITFRKINQCQYILFLFSNSLRVDVKILKSFIVLSLRSPCFQYICRCFSFQNWLFILKMFCGTFFGGSEASDFNGAEREIYDSRPTHSHRHLASGFS